MTAKIFVNNGRAEYTPPVLELVELKIDEGFAISAVKIINNEGRKSSSFTNEDRWYNPAEDQGVGNEYFKQGNTITD